MNATDQYILVRGANDIGSAVAHRLFRSGYPVAIHEAHQPTTTRRRMSFTDAIFDGHAMLEEVEAELIRDRTLVRHALAAHQHIPVVVYDLFEIPPAVLVDARMRKHTQPESQIHLAALTIGLGPNFIAGETTHLVIETARGDSLGRIIEQGPSIPLQGEPIEIEGHARDRYVYAPLAGTFHTSLQIGDQVDSGQEVARINSTLLYAPIPGVLRGLTHDHVPVTQRTKVIEIDPRVGQAQISGISDRPAQIAQGVLQAIQEWEEKHVH